MNSEESNSNGRAYKAITGTQLAGGIAMDIFRQQFLYYSNSRRLALSLGPLNKSQLQQWNKLERDRRRARDVIKRTLIELAEEGTWNTLQEAANFLGQRSTAAVSQKQLYNELKRTRNDIAWEIRSKKNEWSVALREGEQQIAYLRDKIQDENMNTKIRLDYVDKWLCARAESLELSFQSLCSTRAPNLNHEQRVHKELLRAYEIQTDERDKSLEYWRSRYVEEIARINELIAVKRDEYAAAMAKREELQKTYDLHAGEMRGWLNFKAERAARLAREEKRRAKATAIQSWWRGVMVRRGLGAFKHLKNVKSPAKSKKK